MRIFKLAALALAATGFVACANQEDVNDLYAMDRQQGHEIDALEDVVAQLQSQLYTQVNVSASLADSLAALQAQVGQSYESLQSQINTLNNQVYAMQSQICQLQTRETIVGFVDPCGPSGGFNEILIRTSSGKLVAFFEQGGNRFLSLIGPGNYQTTDSQRCSFNVNSVGKVCDNSGCH